MVYYHLSIRGNTYSIQENNFKPKGSNALSTLQKIDQILRNPENYVLALNQKSYDLKEIAAHIYEGYRKKARQLNCVRKLFACVFKKIKAIDYQYHRIKTIQPPPFMNKMSAGPLQSSLYGLPIRELILLRRINKQASPHVEFALFLRAKEFGYKGPKEGASAFFKDLFTEFSVLWRQQEYPDTYYRVQWIPHKLVIYYPRSSRINVEKTLLNFAHLTPAELLLFFHRNQIHLLHFFTKLLKDQKIKKDPSQEHHLTSLLDSEVSHGNNLIRVEFLVHLGARISKRILSGALAGNRAERPILEFLTDHAPTPVLKNCEFFSLRPRPDLLPWLYEKTQGTIEGLFLRVCHGNAEIVRAFLREFPHVNINALDLYGRSALYCAICLRRQDIALLLLHQGTDPLLGSGAPLPLAIHNGMNLEIMTLLAKKCSTQINQIINEQSPLMMAIQRRNLDLVKILLAHGANPNISPCTPPLSYAASLNEVDIAKTLIAAGAHLDALDHQDQSALVHGIRHSAIVELLISHNANPQNVEPYLVPTLPTYDRLQAYLKLWKEREDN